MDENRIFKRDGFNKLICGNFNKWSETRAKAKITISSYIDPTNLALSFSISNRTNLGKNN
jgi:hypothetical protein